MANRPKRPKGQTNNKSSVSNDTGHQKSFLHHPLMAAALSGFLATAGGIYLEKEYDIYSKVFETSVDSNTELSKKTMDVINIITSIVDDFEDGKPQLSTENNRKLRTALISLSEQSRSLAIQLGIPSEDLQKYQDAMTNLMNTASSDGMVYPAAPLKSATVEFLFQMQEFDKKVANLIRS